jgi:hypothetical protein
MPDQHETSGNDDRDILARWLSGRDERCPICKYSLRDLSSNACPECGSVLTLRVWSSDLNMVPWLVAVVTVASIFGIAVFGLIVSFTALRDPELPPAARFAVVGFFAGFAALFGFVLLRLVRRRHHFLRQSRRRQWMIAGICILLTVSCLGAMIASVIVDVVSER